MEEGRVKTEEGALRKHFENEERMRVAMECGTHSPWISRLLAKLGHEVIVANARKLKAVTQEEVETIAGMPNNWRNPPIGVRSF